jgi:hypothetical protein
MWLATYCWKALDKGYNFASNLIAIEYFYANLWALKVARVPAMGISGLRNPETKSHLDVAPVKSYIVYYKGEGGGFPQISDCGESCESELLVARLSTKSAPTMHYPPCVGSCRFVYVCVSS